MNIPLVRIEVDYIYKKKNPWQEVLVEAVMEAFKSG